MTEPNLTVSASRRPLNLKVDRKIGEPRQFEKVATGRRMVDVFALERPRKVVWNENGIESGGEGRIDVGLRTIADHPRRAGLAGVMGREAAIGGVVLFRENFDSREVRGKAGATKLVCLLGVVALGDKNEPMTRGKIGQSFGHMRKKFDLLIGDGLGEAGDAIVLLRCDGPIGELLETGDEGAAEAMQTVAMGHDIGSFNAVETLADLLGVVDMMIEIGDEGGDGLLEVDVVLP